MKTVICVKGEIQGRRSLKKVIEKKALLGIKYVYYNPDFMRVVFEDGSEYKVIEYRNFYGVIADNIIIDDILTEEERARVMTYAPLRSEDDGC